MADMQFWYKNESMEGLSAASLIFGFVCEVSEKDVFLAVQRPHTSPEFPSHRYAGCTWTFFVVSSCIFCMLPPPAAGHWTVLV